MADTFAFLNKAQGDTSEQNSAQEFLKKYKDRYTPDQLKSLEDNGGPSQLLETKYNSVVSNQDEIDAATPTDARRGIAKGGDLDHYGNMYESGQWASGELSAEDLAKKYNLDRSQANSPDNRNVDAGHIWGKGPDGKDIYLGKATMGIGSNKDLIASHATQLYGDEVVHNQSGSNLDTFGDIQGALLAEWDGGGKPPEAKTEQVAIEHSPEIQQAKERVATYENDIISGKTSEDIYGGNDKYSFDAAKGAAGIGTPQNGDSIDQAQKATKSFLNNKKSKIKDKYQFQAQ